MKINNSDFGGFMVSKNVIAGRPILYSFREESPVPVLNGWNFYSDIDDENYISNPNNFEIVSAETLFKIAPVMMELFDAPYGTDLAWTYEQGVHTGFYDLAANKETSIDEIVDPK